MLTTIEISKIVIPENDRPSITDDSVQELLNSIKEVGILQAPVVRPLMNSQSGEYELVAGFRRHHSAILAKYTSLDCNVQELDDTQARIVRLTENLQREDLHPLHESTAYQELCDLGKNPKEIALKIGKPLNHVEQFLRLQSLSKRVQKEFLANELQLGHAKVMMVLPPAVQNQALDNIKNHYNGFDYFDTPTALVKYINRSIIRSLNDPGFDTERTKGFGKAGACVGCPFNSSTAPGLFGGINADSVCTKYQCYDNKVAITVDERNEDLLQKHSMKVEKVQRIHNHYGSWNGCIGKSDYRLATVEDTENVTLGVKDTGTDNGSGLEIVEIVITKEKNKAEPQKEPEVLIFEKPHEEFAGRLERRRAKELNADTHAARATMVETIAADEREGFTDWEFYQFFLDYVLHKESDYSILEELGVEKEEGGYYTPWKINIPEEIRKQPISKLVRLTRKLMAKNHVNASEKQIADLPIERDIFRQHAENLGISYQKLVNAEHDKRKDTHKAEDDKLTKMKDTAEKKNVRAMEYIAEAPDHDPILVKIMKAKKPATVIKKQEPEYLTTLSRKLGSKTKKGADAVWYAKVLPTRLAELEELRKAEDQGIESAQERANLDDIMDADVIAVDTSTDSLDVTPAVVQPETA